MHKDPESIDKAVRKRTIKGIRKRQEGYSIQVGIWIIDGIRKGIRNGSEVVNTAYRICPGIRPNIRPNSASFWDCVRNYNDIWTKSDLIRSDSRSN